MMRGMVKDERMMKNEMLNDEMKNGDMKKDEMKMGEMKKGVIERGLLKRDAGVSTALGTVLLLVIVVIIAGLACVAVFSAADAGNTYTPVVFFQRPRMNMRSIMQEGRHSQSMTSESFPEAVTLRQRH